MDHPWPASKGTSEKNEVSRVVSTLWCGTGDWQGFRISSKGCQCSSSSSTILRMPGFCHQFFGGISSHQLTWKYHEKNHLRSLHLHRLDVARCSEICEKKIGIAWWASNIAVGSSSGKAKGPWRKNPFSWSNHADVHTPLLHNFVRYETLGKLKLTLCDINSIDWTLLSFLGQVTCSWCLSSFELGPWQLKGQVMPTIFVIIHGGNFKCEVNPLKAPWQIRSLFWALLEICRQLNVKVSRQLEIMPQYMTQSPGFISCASTKAACCRAPIVWPSKQHHCSMRLVLRAPAKHEKPSSQIELCAKVSVFSVLLSWIASARAFAPSQPISLCCTTRCSSEM